MLHDDGRRRVNDNREARVRCSIPIVALAGWLAFSASGYAQEPANLAKLNDTFVDASSVNGGRPLDNVFYGALNLFDGGDNVVNNINYTYWMSDSAPRHWIKLRFGAPVEVRSILLELNAAEPVGGDGKLPSRRPEGFALDVTRLSDDGEVIQKLPSVKVDGFRVFYPLEQPLADVLELLVVFPGPSLIEVAELEVLGIPSNRNSREGEGPRIREPRSPEPDPLLPKARR